MFSSLVFVSRSKKPFAFVNSDRASVQRPVDPLQRFVRQSRSVIFSHYVKISCALTKLKLIDPLSSFHAGPQNSESSPEDGKIKSAVLYSDTRRYYLDLKENDRGRFLRVSQTVRNNRNRTQIGIPAQGMIEFRDALTDLLDEYGATDEDDKHANSGK